jgi:hypothetical protein
MHDLALLLGLRIQAIERNGAKSLIQKTRILVFGRSDGKSL